MGIRWAVAAAVAMVALLAACEGEGTEPNDFPSQGRANNLHLYGGGVFRGVGGFANDSERDPSDFWAIQTTPTLAPGYYYLTGAVPGNTGMFFGWGTTFHTDNLVGVCGQDWCFKTAAPVWLNPNRVYDFYAFHEEPSDGVYMLKIEPA